MTKINGDYVMITTTCVNKENAKTLAKALLEKRLGACVQMLPIKSMYVWQNKICDENEILLLIKTKAEIFDEIADTIKEDHSYEVPEIIQIPITDGLPEYLKRIGDAVEKNC